MASKVFVVFFLKEITQISCFLRIYQCVSVLSFWPGNHQWNVKPVCHLWTEVFSITMQLSSGRGIIKFLIKCWRKQVTNRKLRGQCRIIFPVIPRLGSMTVISPTLHNWGYPDWLQLQTSFLAYAVVSRCAELTLCALMESWLPELFEVVHALPPSLVLFTGLIPEFSWEERHYIFNLATKRVFHELSEYVFVNL